MKNFIITLLIFLFSINLNAQDSSFVYQEEGMIRINNIENVPIFINPSHISFRQIRDNFYIKCGLTRNEYNIGTYTEVFKRDTSSFIDNEDLFSYLTMILNRNVTDVFVQDQTTSPIELWLHNDDSQVTVSDTLRAGSQTIPLASGHGFSVGDFFYCDWESPFLRRPRVFQSEVITVYTDSVIVGVPFYEDLAPSNIRKSTLNNIDFAVNASITDKHIFHVQPPPGVTWDLTRLMITMILSSQPDDGLFGNITRLTNGVYFGVEQSNFIGGYVGTFHDNSDFRSTAYDVNYVVRSGGQGSWGLSVRKTFSGQDKYGVAIRLDGDVNEEFIGVVQDNLTGINQFRVKIMGHIVEE